MKKAEETPISEDFTLTDSTRKWITTEYPQLDPDKTVVAFDGHPAWEFIGVQKNSLTILSPAENKRNSTGAIAECACGEVRHISLADWKSGRQKSCGCLRDYYAGLAIRKHSREDQYTYAAWCRMKIRCKDDPSSPCYKYYFVRGITVCDRWKNSFANFISDMGRKPRGMSLDRIDGSKGYMPENCRWATNQEQSANRPGFNVMIEYLGEKKNVADWERALGLKDGIVRNRLHSGWDPIKALSTPIKYNARWHRE